MRSTSYLLLRLAIVIWITIGSAAQPSRAQMLECISDEFNGAALNSNVWSTAFYYGRVHNSKNYYAEDDVLVQNGLLRLRAQQRTAIYWDVTYSYTAGMVSSHHKAWGNPEGTWIQVWARFPAGQGFWPAIWLLPEDRSWPPEIDVAEVVGYDVSKAYCNWHWRDANGDAVSSLTSHLFSNGDATSWHKFGLWWKGNYIAWYIDGVLVKEATANIPQKPMYLVINFAVGSKDPWIGTPNGSTVFPNYFEINSVYMATSTPVSEGAVYRVRNAMSGKYMTAKGVNVNVVQAAWSSLDTQRWRFRKSGSEYRLEPKSSTGCFLEAKSDGKIRVASGAGTPAQSWIMNPLAFNRIRLSPSSNASTFAASPSVNEGADLQQLASAASAAQEWVLEVDHP